MTVERVVLWWVDRYTSGLPAAALADRRDEVASDLWEHRAALGRGWATDLSMLARCARGAPADLSWRRAQRTGRRLPGTRTAAKALGWALAAASFLFLVGQFAWAASAAVGFDFYGHDWAPGDVAFFSRVCAALLVALVGGAIAIPRHPRGGAALVVATLVAIPVVFWWAAPIYVPMNAAVAAAAIVLARRTRRRQARAISATS
jgi:hypothetical protein